ncbi:uncharacterized protein LOC105226923 isoform X2 [Bactrocera dorsalis]|uniref:Uncharacterized protein LOC105226923 isoform X2 n=1 Tax=Bactrocera dorsalis TaxID=27457 RepID=A0ABM3K4L4_BACDO|nr:uncharacterized protein LOC105226923 isoform X2 [Bactrocera dorsalis]
MQCSRKQSYLHCSSSQIGVICKTTETSNTSTNEDVGSPVYPMLSGSNATLASITKISTIEKTKDTLTDVEAFNCRVSYMNSLTHLLRADIDQDDRDHRKYSSEKMRHFRCKEHINCDFNCCNNKYLAKNDRKLPKNTRAQKNFDIPSPPLFTEIDANDRKKIPRTVRESTQSDNKLFIRQQQDQHNLYILYRRLAAKLLYTSTTTSEAYSLTPPNANGRANSGSIFSEIETAYSEKFSNILIQQHDVQSANSYDNSLNENASEPPKLSFDATALQKCNHCNDIDLDDIDSTIPLTMPMEKRPIQITSIDGFFNRKRGRPPKNRYVEVYKNANQSPQAIFTSFKLEKNATPNDGIASMNDKQIFDYGSIFHNAVRMVTIPATINPGFAAISQLPIDATTDSTVKLETELDLQQEARSSVAQRHTEATMNTAMKGEMESLNKRHDQPSQHRNKGILNTNDLEYREGYIHMIPASPQRTVFALLAPSFQDATKFLVIRATTSYIMKTALTVQQQNQAFGVRGT